MQAGTAPLPRLLRGVGREPIVSLQRHLDLHGPLRSDVSADVLITEIEQSGLRGHGGAGFPTGRKLRTVAGGRGSKTVVINGTEGEPASKKDRAMLREAPHLVLDGAAVAARAVGAGVAYIAHCERDVRGAASLEAAIDERAGLRGDPEFVRFEAPELFLSGQETALINLINGGACTPTFDRRPFERGVRGRPTLVQNAETTAHLALIARHGARWFRQLGPESDPGSALLTVSGAVEAPGVYEIEHGTSLESMLETVRVREPLRAVLIGGYFGSWLPVGRVGSTDLSPTALREQGASLGAGVIVALGRSACPVAELARVTRWFAEQSAGQCGPCVHGLDAVAEAFRQIAAGSGDAHVLRDLHRWTAELPGRGACRHPDGAAAFISSALEVFDAELEDHAGRGPCPQCEHRPVLPVPTLSAIR